MVSLVSWLIHVWHASCRKWQSVCVCVCVCVREYEVCRDSIVPLFVLQCCSVFRVCTVTHLCVKLLLLHVCVVTQNTAFRSSGVSRVCTMILTGVKWLNSYIRRDSIVLPFAWRFCAVDSWHAYKWGHVIHESRHTPWKHHSFATRIAVLLSHDNTYDTHMTHTWHTHDTHMTSVMSHMSKSQHTSVLFAGRICGVCRVGVVTHTCVLSHNSYVCYDVVVLLFAWQICCVFRVCAVTHPDITGHYFYEICGSNHRWIMTQ